MPKYKCIVDIRVGYSVNIEAENAEEAKKEAMEYAWDGMYFSPTADVSTNDVECFDAELIKDEEK
jgi:hypothetical protein